MSKPDVEVMRDLLARVKAATGPDRTLDVRLLAALAQPGEWARADIEYACANPERTCSPPHYTASIDAAVALMERVLPGWDFHLYRDDDGQFAAEMIWPEGVLTPDAGYFGCDGRGANRALAIVAGVIEGALTLAHQEAALTAAEDHHG